MSVRYGLPSNNPIVSTQIEPVALEAALYDRTNSMNQLVRTYHFLRRHFEYTGYVATRHDQRVASGHRIPVPQRNATIVPLNHARALHAAERTRFNHCHFASQLTMGTIGAGQERSVQVILARYARSEGPSQWT